MIRKCLLGLMIASVASLAWAGIPDAGESEVWVGEYPGFTNCGAWFTWDGDGTALENAPRRGMGGGHDCTIWAQVRNSAGNPIPLTAGDVWLEWGGVITLCGWTGEDYALAMAQGAFPGLFYWEGTRPSVGAGEFHKVFVLGTEITQQAQIGIISPDLNGDKAINALDRVAFNSLLGTADYRGDFNFDGVVNALDRVTFNGFIGTPVVCP